MNTALLSTRQLTERFGVAVEADGLDHGADIPVIAARPQRQGDVYIAYRPELTPATTPVPVEGVAVVKGENGGNTHLLLGATPGVFFDAAPSTGDTLQLDLGTLTVEEGAVAYLAHPEHGYMGFGGNEGGCTYLVKRQREQRHEVTAVSD